MMLNEEADLVDLADEIRRVRQKALASLGLSPRLAREVGLALEAMANALISLTVSSDPGAQPLYAAMRMAIARLIDLIDALPAADAPTGVTIMVD
jgi:hypothetical protein